MRVALCWRGKQEREEEDEQRKRKKKSGKKGVKREEKMECSYV